MGYVIPPGFSRITFNFLPISTVGSRPCWGFGVASSPDGTKLAELSSWVLDDYLPAVSTEMELESLEMRNDVEAIEVPIGIGGGTAGAPATPQNAVLCKVTSGLTGRSNRGRWFWPGMVIEDEVSPDGRLFDGYRSSLQDLADGLRVAVGLAGMEDLVILHSTSSDPTPVNAVTIQQHIATQRRRMRS